MAVRVSRGTDLHRRAMGAAVSLSPSRVRDPTGSCAGGTTGWHRKAGGSTHVPAFLCDPSARGRVRHSYGSGAPWRRRREYDDGVHARRESRPTRCAQPCRPPLTFPADNGQPPRSQPTGDSAVERVLRNCFGTEGFCRRVEWQATRGWLQAAASNVLFAANPASSEHAAIGVNIRRHRDIRIGDGAASSANGCVGNRPSTPREVRQTEHGTRSPC